MTRKRKWKWKEIGLVKPKNRWTRQRGRPKQWKRNETESLGDGRAWESIEYHNDLNGMDGTMWVWRMHDKKKTLKRERWKKRQSPCQGSTKIRNKNKLVEPSISYVDTCPSGWVWRKPGTLLRRTIEKSRGRLHTILKERSNERRKRKRTKEREKEM